MVIDAEFRLKGFEVSAFPARRGEEGGGKRARQVAVMSIDGRALFHRRPDARHRHLFVPSEAIYADRDEHFTDLGQKANRARIVICAPKMRCWR